MKTMSAGFDTESYRKIKYIWKWEWIHGLRAWLIEHGIQWGLMLAAAIAYRLLKSYLFRITGALFQLPSCFIRLLGIDEGTQTGSFSFYLLYLLMFVNAWNVWRACRRAIRTVDRDEITGSIYLMCNQWYERTFLAWGRWSWNVAMYAAGQALTYVGAVLFALIGNSRGDQWLSAMGRLGTGFLISVFVGICFLSLSYWYALSHRRKLRKPASAFVDKLFWLPLLLANIYKVRDVVYWYLGLLEIAVPEQIVAVLDPLPYLYWISPLTWMNPFIEMGTALRFLQVGLCVALAALGTALGVKNCMDREFLC